jgi:hypothetical protein
VDNQAVASEVNTVSRAELSLEISRLVPRLLKGESIDLGGKAEELAARFPDLGMTAAMIGSAIERTTTMVDQIRNRPEPLQATAAAPDYAGPVEEANGHGADHTNSNGGDHASDIEGMLAIEMPRAAALSEFTFGEKPEAAAMNGNGNSPHANVDEAPAANGETAQPARSRFASGAITTLRRALFRN